MLPGPDLRTPHAGVVRDAGRGSLRPDIGRGKGVPVPPRVGSDRRGQLGHLAYPLRDRQFDTPVAGAGDAAVIGIHRLPDGRGKWCKPSTRTRARSKVKGSGMWDATPPAPIRRILKIQVGPDAAGNAVHRRNSVGGTAASHDPALRRGHATRSRSVTVEPGTAELTPEPRTERRRLSLLSKPGSARRARARQVLCGGLQLRSCVAPRRCGAAP